MWLVMPHEKLRHLRDRLHCRYRRPGSVQCLSLLCIDPTLTNCEGKFKRDSERSQLVLMPLPRRSNM